MRGFERDLSERRARARAHLDRVRQRRGRARRGPPRGALAVVVLAAVLGAVAGDGLLVRLLSGSAHPVDVIAVHGAVRLSPAEVAGATGIPADAKLAAVDASAVASSLETHDWIASARALRLPGGAVVVGVAEREPVATVALDDTRFAVDAEGRPFAPLDDDGGRDLLRLVAAAEVKPREPDARLARAVRLARRLPELGMAAPREIRISDATDPEGYALQLEALDAKVVLGHVDLDERLEDLARLVAARPDAVAEASFIDLRFANQVVLRSEPAREGPAETAAGRGSASLRTRQPAG